MQKLKSYKTKNRRHSLNWCQHQSWPRRQWRTLRRQNLQYTGRNAGICDVWKQKYHIKFKDKIFHTDSMYLIL